MEDTPLTSGLISDVRQYLSGLDMRLKFLRHTRAELDAQFATEFSVFRYLVTDEVKLSDLISDLLSPEGTHGQGETFLSLFLKRIGRPVAEKPIVAAGSIRVIREDCTRYCPNFRRRIDITIDFGTLYGIGLENKPFAEEGDDQLADYADHLNRKYGGNYTLVFLSNDGRAPQSISGKLRDFLSHSQKLVVLSYEEDILNWLRDCWRECRADRVRWFLSDFSNWVSRAFPSELLSEGHNAISN